MQTPTSAAKHLPISFWQLGWRNLWRDVRAGELRLLLVAVLLAVSALSAVAFFSNRLDGALRRDAAQLLGGDLVISSDQPLPAAYAAEVQALGLQSTSTQTFATMARAPEAQGATGRLVTLKAVGAGYPLRGTLRASEDSRWQPGAADHPAPPPQSGQVWVEAPLLEALQLKVGDNMLLGSSTLRITQVLTQEPDRGGGFISFSPRVLMHANDLAATGLVQPASRVTYRLAVVGKPAAVQQLNRWAKAEIAKPGVRGIRVETLEDGNPRMQETLQRAGNFLNLVALLAALLSAVAVALAARGFAGRHLDGCAMLRVLGVRQRTMALAYSLEFALIGLLGSVIGTVLGFAVHHVFVALLGNMMQTALPAPGWPPIVLGLGVGMTLLLAFGLPPVLQLAGTPPLRVIRREMGRLKPASALAIAAGAAGFAALLLAASSDLKLGGIAVGGFAGAVLAFMALGWLAVTALQRAAQAPAARTLPHWLRLAMRQLGARPAFAVVQISSLAVGLMALALLVLLRTDLVRSWQQATPVDAPNRYVINILPEQQAPFQAALRSAGVAQFDWYPMVRGRLIEVNGRSLAPSDYPDDQAKRLIEREFNLSYSADAPAWTPIMQGAWTPGDANGISMEEGIMKTLKLQLGDRVVFDMGGVQRLSTITSVRKVNWSSMHVNFFAMYPVADMGEQAAVTYITAYRSPPRVDGQPSLDYRLLQTYPNITQVDMDSTLNQLQAVLGKVIRAVEMLFGFGLVAGVLVLFSTINTTREERAHEFAIMRALGAGSGLLGRVQNAELLAVGAVAGLLAGAVALGIGWALAHYVFEFEWAPALWILPATSVAGAVLAWAAGWWSLRSVLKQPVVQTLRLAM